MNNREDFDKYIMDTYGVCADFPWGEDGPAVYRHMSNGKCFAFVMTVHKSRFGLDDDCYVDIVNLKCDPLMIGSLYKENGVYPAYHMNKNHWISVFLDGNTDVQTVKWLVSLSAEFTDKPKKK